MLLLRLVRCIKSKAWSASGGYNVFLRHVTMWTSTFKIRHKVSVYILLVHVQSRVNINIPLTCSLSEYAYILTLDIKEPSIIIIIIDTILFVHVYECENKIKRTLDKSFFEWTTNKNQTDILRAILSIIRSVSIIVNTIKFMIITSNFK